MKNIKRLMALLLAASMMLSVVACGSKEKADDNATYTYRGTTSQVSTWNPTDWLFSSEAALIGYTTSPLYEFNMNEDKTGYVIEPEVATEAPKDVTADYAGDEVYGVPADATEGYAYQVSIREDFTWADGTKITVDDYSPGGPGNGCRKYWVGTETDAAYTFGDFICRCTDHGVGAGPFPPDPIVDGRR